MRRTAFLQAKKRQVVTGRSIPFPVEGWNTAVALSEMSPKQAIILDNIIPRQAYGELRKGAAAHCPTGASDPVNTLMAYQSLSGTADKLFAAAGDTIYDATSAVPSSVVTGLTNSRWQYVNYTTTGGHFLYAVNGTDDPEIWNGATWTNPTITGATASSFIGINVFKARLFFCANEKLGFYYLPVDSIQGAAAFFELGNIFTMGGYLMAMGTWTIDGGAGVDDHAVFMSSRGQTAVYQGTNPGDATAWSLIGVFNLPAPIGRRCMTKVGGDLYITTISGVIPLSRSLILDKAAVNNVAITQNISPTMTSSAQLYGSNFGWQLIGYPKATIALLNVPITEGVVSYQYVMNTLSGAWCRFTGLNASCFELLNDDLYFGGAGGIVYKADVAATDAGVDITGDLKTSFNYFGMRGFLKRFTMLRPLLTSDGTITPLLGLNVDFQDALPTGTVEPSYSAAIYWDQFDWDEANWPPDQVTQSVWQTVSGIGYCASIRFRIVATVQNAGNLWDLGTWDNALWDGSNPSPVLCQINSFDIMMEPGGFI